MRADWIALALLATVAPALTAADPPSRTPDGKPDLQGVWTNVTVTPLERPADLGDKQFFTKEEAARYAKDTV
jgi:hypothetical protein